MFFGFFLKVLVIVVVLVEDVLAQRNILQLLVFVFFHLIIKRRKEDGGRFGAPGECFPLTPVFKSGGEIQSHSSLVLVKRKNPGCMGVPEESQKNNDIF